MFEMNTLRLHIQGPKMTDFPTYWAMITDQETTCYIGGRSLSTVIEAESYYQKKCLLFQGVGNHDFSVVDSETNQYIGYCGVDYNPFFQSYELSFGFMRAVWHKGYASEAVKAVLDFSENKIHLEQLIALVHPRNTAAILILQDMGFAEITRSAKSEESDLIYHRFLKGAGKKIRKQGPSLTKIGSINVD